MRQRRNRAATRARLPAEGAEEREIPALPRRGRRKWDALTVAWWEDAWRSPMASEWLEADRHGLYMLAELVDRFWKVPTIAMVAEIRHQSARFGLSPIDRRRLEWEVQRVEASRKPAAPPPRRMVEEDPRRQIFAVK